MRVDYPPPDALSFDRDFAVVDHTGDARRNARSQPLGHGDHQDAAVCFGQQAILKHREPSARMSNQINATHQTVVLNASWHPPHRRSWSETSDQIFYPGIANGTRRSPHSDAA